MQHHIQQKNRYWLLGVLAATSVSASTVAAAETVTLRAGGYAQVADIELSSTANNEGQPGTTLSLKDLGHDDSETSPWIDLNWQISPRWSLLANYSRFSSEGANTLDYYFDFGDIEVPVDIEEIEGSVKTESSFDSNLYIVNLGYRVYDGESASLDLGTGLHWVEMDVSLSAELTANNLTESLGTARSDVSAPLPNLIAHGSFSPYNNWTLNAMLGWFSLSYEEYRGELSALDINLEYSFTPHFGLGAGYRWIHYDLQVEEDRFTHEFDAQFSGPTVYGAFSF